MSEDFTLDGEKIPDGYRECTRCFKVKIIEDFYRDPTNTKIMKRCMDCRAARRKSADGTLSRTGPKPKPRAGQTYPAAEQMHHPELLRRKLR